MLHLETARRIAFRPHWLTVRRDQLIASVRSLSLDPAQVALYFVFGALLLGVAVASAVSPTPWLVVALVGGLILAGVAVSHPSMAVLLVFGGAGLAATQIPIPGHQVRLLEPALAFCLAAILVRHTHVRVGVAHLLALLFAAIAVISFIHAPEFVTAVNAAGANKDLYDYLLLVVAFWCGSFLAGWIRDASSFLRLVLLANIPPFLIGLSQVLNIQIPSLFKIEFAPARVVTQSQGRVFGPFSGPATFGMYLINLFAIGVACWLIGRTRRYRVFGAIMTLLSALFIIETGTRSALIAVGVILIVGAIISRRYKLVLATLFLAGAAIIPFIGKVLAQFQHPDASETNRVFLWQQALALIAGHPWIGIGLEGFTKYYQTLVVSRQLRLDPTGVSVHNQYLEIAMQSGVLWLLVTVLWLVAMVALCWRAYGIAPRSQRPLLLAAILALLGNISTCFVDVPLEHVEGGVFLMLLAGLGLGYADRVWQARRRDAGEVPGAASSPEWLRTRLGLSPLWPRAISATGVGVGLYRRARAESRLWAPAPVAPVAQAASGAVASTTLDTSAPAAVSIQGAGRTIAIRLFSWGVAIPITFPANILLAHYLGPTRYGEYSFVAPFLLVFALVGGLGLDAVIVRQLTHEPRARWQETLSFAAGTRLVATTVVVGVAALVAFVLPVSTEQRVLLLLASPLLLFSYRAFCYRTMFECGFRAEQRVSIPSVLETTDRIATASLIVVIVLFHLSLVWAFILITYSDLPFFLALAHINLRRFGLRPRFSLARAREHLRSGLPLMGYSLLSLSGTQADVFVLMALAGSTSVGIYALALRLTDPVLTVITTYVTGLYPLLCAKASEGGAYLRTVYHNSARVMALAVFPLAIYVIVISRKVVTLLGGPGFLAAAPVLELLMCVVAITLFNRLATYTCMAVHLERSIPYVTAVTAVTNLLANLALIPRWQVEGAALAAVISELAEFSVLSALLMRHTRLAPPLGAAGRVLAGVVPGLIFLVWQQHASLLLITPIFIVLVVAGYVIIGAVSMRDVESVRSMLLTRRLAIDARPNG